MNKLKIYNYRHFEIHLVNGTYKYDIYHAGLWFTSVNSLNQAKQYVKNVIWTRKEIPQ